ATASSSRPGGRVRAPPIAALSSAPASASARTRSPPRRVRAAPPSRTSATGFRPAPIAAPAARKSGESSMHIVSRQPSEAAPARIAPLSVLPVFLDLNGKRAVVAGGSDAAAWKAELLAAAGAKVHVHAPASEVDGQMRRLFEAQEAGLVHHDAPWRPEALAGAAVAVADARTQDEARAFHDAARLAG